MNVLLLEDIPDPTEVDAYRKAVEEAGVFEVTIVVHPNSIRAYAWSLQIDSGIQKTLAQISVLFNPELLLCLDLRCAWSAVGCEAHAKIAWLGDLNFQTLWYHALYSYKEGQRPLWKLPIDLIRSQYWKKPYRTVLPYFSRIFVASKSSETALRRLGMDASYLPYPWPAKPLHVHSHADDRPTLVFCGTLGALGSRSSFHVLIKHIYPALLDYYGQHGFRIRICGRGRLATWVEDAFRERPEFEILGFVPAVEPILVKCHALIVPVEVPVGNRSRILTALSQKLLVIAHSNTALGNPDLKNGNNCYLADTPREFVDRIRDAVAEPEATHRIAERGFALYTEKFAPTKAVSLLLNEIAQFHKHS